MRLVVHGQQAFGASVLDALLKRGDNVVAVFCGPDKGPKPDPLKEAAQKAGLPLHQPKSYKTPEALEQFKALNADLCLMAYVTLFVPSAVLNAPRLGSIQYHPSLLPLHRGPSSINWPIVQGATKTGLTIFWPDDGLDTGPVLMQKTVDIGPDDTIGKVYFDKLFPLGVEAMLESLDLVKAGKAPRLVQDETKATYESWCKPDNARIDWFKTVHQTYDLIRGCDPAPAAWTVLDGKKVQLFDCRKIVDRRGTMRGNAGEVAEIDADGFTVMGVGGAIRVGRVKPEDGAKQKAGDWAKIALKPGTRFS
ncbi:MAG: methionyl-tRNA formyltransferase [Alphaproteobacteria bacterium]|nr:methionyl-tRNA formyltransferase [Alphaproteobacteria bacterium]